MVTSQDNTRTQDHTIEVFLGRLLQSCVILTVIIVLIGVAIYLPGARNIVRDYNHFSGEPAMLRSVTQIFQSAFKGDGRAVIQLGLLVLILTPILRVTCSVFAFLYERDYLYVILTLVVLALLMYSLLAG